MPPLESVVLVNGMLRVFDDTTTTTVPPLIITRCLWLEKSICWSRVFIAWRARRIHLDSRRSYLHRARRDLKPTTPRGYTLEELHAPDTTRADVPPDTRWHAARLERGFQFNNLGHSAPPLRTLAHRGDK